MTAWRNLKWCVIGLPLLSGCTLYSHVFRNLYYEPKLHFGETAIKHDLKRQAKEYWADYVAAHPTECFSKYFFDGFVTGFSDYLDSGGNGDPPAMPPLRYRSSNKYFSPEGFQAIEDFFAGFRVGARIAIDSGIRDTLVVPILLPVTPPKPAPAIAQTDKETLPMPKSAAGSEGEAKPADPPKNDEPKAAEKPKTIDGK
jgi:hypothetical protein